MRVFDLEGLADEVVNEVDHRAFHVLQGNLIHEDRCAVALDHDIVVLPGTIHLEGVLEAGAAAAIDADSQHRAGGFGRHDLMNSAGGAFGEGNIGHCCIRSWTTT